jgi:hypothetical protein
MMLGGNLPGGQQAPMAASQSQAMASPMGAPQQPQGLGALQSAYSQFMNAQPQQPSPMFGQQPMDQQMNPMQQQAAAYDLATGAPVYGYQQPSQPQNYTPEQTQLMEQVRQQRMQQPMMQQPPMRAPMMPQAPTAQQVRPEDQRMQAMRNMQRTRGYNR